jgi:O-methyltransferase
MPISIFQLINFTIILVVFVLLIRYAWGMFFDENYQPVEWLYKKKQGLITKELLKLEKNYADKVRFFNWWFQVERLKRENVPGVFAELGVYKGESARILHRMDPERELHLFDTFEGLKEKDLKSETGEAATYTTKNFADTNVEKVRRFIDGNENVIFHPGYFPELAVGGWRSAESKEHGAGGRGQGAGGRGQGAGSLEPGVGGMERGPETGNRKPETDNTELTLFALVNIDADLYNPTKAGLEFFYPRLSPSGVIIVHDYTHKWEGVMTAVDEFIKTIPESLVTLPDMNGTVMIIRNKF